MTCSSTFRAEIFPFLYERRHKVFISSPMSLEMRVDKQNVNLSIANEHTRLYKLDIHTLTIYLKPNWLLIAPLIHRNHFHHLQGLIYALKHASSIKYLHVHFAAEFQPPPSDVVRVIETAAVEQPVRRVGRMVAEAGKEIESGRGRRGLYIMVRSSMGGFPMLPRRAVPGRKGIRTSNGCYA
jgi:hypothetical protein